MGCYPAMTKEPLITQQQGGLPTALCEDARCSRLPTVRSRLCNIPEKATECPKRWTRVFQRLQVWGEEATTSTKDNETSGARDIF